MRRGILLIGAVLLLIPIFASAQSPTDRTRIFRDELRAFAYDLAEARDAELHRVRRIAYVAMIEAYRYDLPPALVFGVLLQETIDLDPEAVSVAGARGIMQIMPNIWLPVLRPYFGSNLFDDTTNIRYGTWILAHYAYMSRGDMDQTLRRYSGGARRYSERVRRHVEERAPNLCPERSAAICVEDPLLSRFR